MVLSGEENEKLCSAPEKLGAVPSPHPALQLVEHRAGLRGPKTTWSHVIGMSAGLGVCGLWQCASCPVAMQWAGRGLKLLGSLCVLELD